MVLGREETYVSYEAYVPIPLSVEHLDNEITI